MELMPSRPAFRPQPSTNRAARDSVLEDAARPTRVSASSFGLAPEPSPG